MDRLHRAHHADAGAGKVEIELDGEESHHVLRVLRLHPGDPLSVFDGCGREWSARLIRVDAGRARVHLGEERLEPVEPRLRVVLHQALSRPERIEWVLQKGTEIGVAAFKLQRSLRGLTEAPSPARLDRWRRVVLEAAKQSGRRLIPTIDGPFPSLDDPPPGVLALVLDPAPGGKPLGRALLQERAGEVWIAVGPEGGFSDEEADRFCGQGWIRCHLGPRILRTETAGPVAAAIVLCTWGDLGSA